MFNTGGKNDLGKIWQNSCKNMSKSFESIVKTTARIYSYGDVIVTWDSYEEEQADLMYFSLALQGWRTVFDLFGAAAPSTDSTPNPTDLMDTIDEAYTAMSPVR